MCSQKERENVSHISNREIKETKGISYFKALAKHGAKFVGGVASTTIPERAGGLVLYGFFIYLSTLPKSHRKNFDENWKKFKKEVYPKFDRVSKYINSIK